MNFPRGLGLGVLRGGVFRRVRDWRARRELKASGCNGCLGMKLPRMDEATSQNQLGGSGGPAGVANRQNLEEPTQRVQYSIPGILHFIQHEWARFEMERSQWELERAELQVCFASRFSLRLPRDTLWECPSAPCACSALARGLQPGQGRQFPKYGK